jgi:hypothetical protein
MCGGHNKGRDEIDHTPVTPPDTMGGQANCIYAEPLIKASANRRGWKSTFYTRPSQLITMGYITSLPSFAAASKYFPRALHFSRAFCAYRDEGTNKLVREARPLGGGGGLAQNPGL